MYYQSLANGDAKQLEFRVRVFPQERNNKNCDNRNGCSVDNNRKVVKRSLTVGM